MSRARTRCKVCGGLHSPKCRPLPRSADAAIWYALLSGPEASARRMQRQADRRDALARAAGTDAANRQMRAQGRSTWTAADYELAAETYNRLMPEPVPEKETDHEPPD